jgi:hypothetical protein
MFVKLNRYSLKPSHPSALIVVLVIAGLGGFFLINSHAATPYASLTADSGTLAGGAVKQACSGASDGNCVAFGSATSSQTLGDQPSPPELFNSSDGSTAYLTTPIPSSPVLDPNSASMVATIGSNLPSFDGTTADWEIPIYNTTNSDPSYNPSFSESSWGCSVGGSMHIPSYATRELPDATVGGDAWLETVNTDTDTVSAIWQATKSSGTWNASCGGSFPLNGNGFATGEAHPSSVIGLGAGAGEQIGAGLILYSELESGSINHALYMTSSDTCSAYRVPATKSDGHGTGDDCWPEGARIQLNPAVNCQALSGASVAEVMICKTLETYGGYILDSGGSGPLSGIATMGDDMTDPNRSVWQTPGNPTRGTANCAPISASCGVVAHFGVTGSSNDLAQIPWSQIRVLNSWNGS